MASAEPARVGVPRDAVEAAVAAGDAPAAASDAAAPQPAPAYRISAAVAQAARRLAATSKAAAERSKGKREGQGEPAARKRKKRKTGAAPPPQQLQAPAAGIFEPAMVERMLAAAALPGAKQAQRTDGKAPIYMAAVMEYLTAEMLEAAGNAARESNAREIDAKHIQAGFSADDELVQMKDRCGLYGSWKEKQRALKQENPTGPPAAPTTPPAPAEAPISMPSS